MRPRRRNEARRSTEAAPAQSKAHARRGRLMATMIVATLAAFGPVLEGALGYGRGWVIGLVLLLILPSLARAGGPRFHPMDPETFVPASYFLTVAYSPVLSLFTYRGFMMPSRDTVALEVAYAGAAGCAIVCTALSRVREAPDVERLVPMHRPRAMLYIDWATIGIGAIGLGLVGIWIYTIGLGRLFSLTYADTFLAEDGKGVLTSGWYLVQLAIVYCFLRLASSRKAKVPAPRALQFAGWFFLVSFLVNTIIGRRGPLVWAILSVALALHTYGIQIRRLWLALGMVGVVAYGIAIEGARFQQGGGLDSQISAAAARFENLDNPLKIGELEVIYSNLVDIVNERPPIVTYPGESWVNAFLIMVPKPLWSERPLGLAQRYVWWMDPSYARKGGGFAMSAAAEGFLNIGVLGTFIEIGFMSALFFMLPLTMANERRCTLLVRTTAACVASFTYNQFRGEFTAMLKIALSFALAALATVLLAAVIRQLSGLLAALRPLQRRPASSARAAARVGETAARDG
ncbi:hypothetical protein WME90_38165 [Sorangium sp. So ce375]|uniref:hypothetical protein n=1 Tax=Sorangium sp. So ce375 TaxID=3133306 RepID=UPI003F5B8B3E